MKSVNRKALLAFYDRILAHFDLVTVFKIDFVKIMIRFKNEKR